MISSLISLAFVWRSSVLSTSILCTRSFIFCSSLACFRKRKNASVVTTKACGTGNFELYISPRFAPFPPASCRSALDKFDNHAMYLLSLMLCSNDYYI